MESPLLRSRPIPLQVVLAVVVPAAFGSLTGVLLGVSKTAYFAVQAVALLGGYFAGYEHNGGGEGAIRGLLGGATFGGFILIAHHAVDTKAKAKLPDPEVVLIAFTAAFGSGIGALGGRARRIREETPEDERPTIDFKRLHLSEFVGFVGAGILFGSLFLPWFGTSCDANGMPHGCNKFSSINDRMGDLSAWQTFKLLDVLLTMACIAPFVLAWLIVRGQQLSWRPGEVTMIVGMLAFFLILLNGIILGKPGNKVEISIDYGYFVGLAGAACICAGGVVRQASGGRSRRPPGAVQS